ncbi:MAG: hypothetical protein ACLQU1_12105, partial [Bryobacteraceae bacterium]
MPVVSGSETQSGILSPPPLIQTVGAAAQVPFAGLVAPGEFQLNVVAPASPASVARNTARAASPGRAATTVDRQEMVALARTVQRYYNESQAAVEWDIAYTPAIQAHVEGQEYYE